jgi:hypothetical protein
VAPTADQLKAMAEHVRYEVVEFRKAVQSLHALTNKDAQWNPILESGLLHFRVLRGFFFAEGGKADDVFATHYIGGWKPKRASVFDATKDALDKRIAHLTLERLTPWGWDLLGEMSKVVQELVHDFKSGLAEPERSWFANLHVAPVVTTHTVLNWSTKSG